MKYINTNEKHRTVHNIKSYVVIKKETLRHQSYTKNPHIPSQIHNLTDCNNARKF